MYKCRMEFLFLARYLAISSTGIYEKNVGVVVGKKRQIL